jgi:hypothetical protein
MWAGNNGTLYLGLYAARAKAAALPANNSKKLAIQADLENSVSKLTNPRGASGDHNNLAFIGTCRGRLNKPQLEECNPESARQREKGPHEQSSCHLYDMSFGGFGCLRRNELINPRINE